MKPQRPASARPAAPVVLGALRRAGRPLSIAELVEVTGRSWPACRRAVAALERTGDVERVAWSERAHGWGAVPLCATALWRGGLPISLGRPWPWLAWCRSWCGYGSGSAPLGVCLDDGRDAAVSS